MIEFAADRLATERAVFRPAFLPHQLSGFTEKQMTKKTYSEKLRDPRWQKKRLEVLEEAGWACVRCGDTSSTLHAHHKTYLSGREPWEYDSDQLAVLCESCHEAEHALDGLPEVVSRLPLTGRNSRAFFEILISGALGLEYEITNPWVEEAYKLGANLNREFDKAMKPRVAELRRKNGQNSNNKA